MAGTKLFSGSYDNSVGVWDTTTFQSLGALNGHTGELFALPLVLALPGTSPWQSGGVHLDVELTKDNTSRRPCAHTRGCLWTSLLWEL